MNIKASDSLEIIWGIKEVSGLVCLLRILDQLSVELASDGDSSKDRRHMGHLEHGMSTRVWRLSYRFSF